MADSPAWAIIKEAEEWKADLVVVGSQGLSAFGRLIVIAALDLRMFTATWAVSPAMTAGIETTGETDWLHRIAGSSAESLRSAGLAASSLVQEGHPEHVLLEKAKQWGADCIFVGATGLGTLGRLLLGSVSAKVAARAPCSVEVVRRPQK